MDVFTTGSRTGEVESANFLAIENPSADKVFPDLGTPNVKAPSSYSIQEKWRPPPGPKN